MVRLLLCLSLLITWSNANAWYCSYTPTNEGYISNLVCHDIDPTLAVKDYWCPYRNQDPICRQFDIVTQPAIPACTDRTETQSVSCQPHYSGVINQVRTYYCQSNSYSDWVTTSNNCTPDPPSCHISTEERQIACTDGYTGSITQQRTSSCPDPYGQPTFGPWVETMNSCTKSITNVTNPVSPISPISPVTVNQPVETAPAPQEMTQTSTESAPTATENTSNSSKTNTEAPQSIKSDVPISSPKTNENNAPVSVTKGRDLVPGFGIVMSMELLNAPIKFQQQQLEIALEYNQELDNGIRSQQGFLHGLLMEGNSDNFYNIVNSRWNALRSSIEVQPDF